MFFFSNLHILFHNIARQPQRKYLISLHKIIALHAVFLFQAEIMFMYKLWLRVVGHEMHVNHYFFLLSFVFVYIHT